MARPPPLVVVLASAGVVGATEGGGGDSSSTRGKGLKEREGEERRVWRRPMEERS